MTTLRDAAKSYAALGLPVFPCNSDKVPLVGPDKDAEGRPISGTGGFHKATTDPEQIDRWWTKYPDAMIGMPTGPASGIDVLDIDTKHDGFKTLPNWRDLSTVIVRTASGGAHAWFKSSGIIRNTTSEIAEGVDTRGVGGYVILPPSERNGATYTWEKGNANDRANLPPFPLDLAAKFIDRHARRAHGDNPEAAPELIAAALAVIANDGLGWEDWNRIGMATWRATDGNGLVAFDEWSAKSDKYDAVETSRRWNYYSKSPPTQIGAGTIFHMANEASPGWNAAYYDAMVRPVTDEATRQNQRDWMAENVWAKNRKSSGNAKASKPEAEKPHAEAPKADASIRATPFAWISGPEIPKRRWLYRPCYIRQFIALTISTGGMGKSSLIIVEALAMASGKALLGVTPEKPLRVWYWNGEDPTDELQRRLAAAAKHYDLKPEDIGDRLFVDSGRKMPIVIAEEANRGKGTFVSEPVIAEVIATIRENQIDVVIIDPFVSCHRVAENDNAAIERVAKSWSKVAEETNCAIMLSHHSRKTGGEAVAVDDGRGASALRDAARSARTLNKMTDKEAANAEIEERQRGFYFRCNVGKMNLTPPAEAADWFKLESVDLENPGDGDWDSGDHVGVVTAWKYPKVETQRLTIFDTRRALDKIGAGGPWRGDQRSTNEPWVGVPIAEALNLDLGRVPIRRSVVKLIQDWIRQGWLTPVEKRDSKHRPRTYIEVGEIPDVQGGA